MTYAATVIDKTLKPEDQLLNTQNGGNNYTATTTTAPDPDPAPDTGVTPDPTTTTPTPFVAPQTSREGILSGDLNAPEVQSDPNQVTVANQISGLLSKDSPYLTAARQNAMRQAQKRGLLNSSIAAGAGEQAAIQSALPIAQQDASTYAQQALSNHQAATNLMLQQLQTGAQLSIADLDAATKIMGIQMDNDHQLLLQQIIEDNKRALQSDASISTAFSNTMNSIGQAYQNPEMSSAQQKAAAEFFMSSFKSYVEFQDITGSSNYADQFDWGAWDAKGESRSLDPFGTSGQPGETRNLGNASYKWENDRWVDQSSSANLQPFGERGTQVGEVRYIPGKNNIRKYGYTWDGTKWEEQSTRGDNPGRFGIGE